MLVTKRVAEAAGYLRGLGVQLPRRAILLEQGMVGFDGELTGVKALPLRSIPGFAEPRRGEFGGSLLLGDLAGVPTAVVEGGPHLYSGFLPGECGLAVRALAAVGAEALVLVASGSSLLEGPPPGSMFLVLDRLDLTGVAMLKGVHDAAAVLGIDVAPVGPETLRAAAACGETAGVAVSGGVAALVHGPLRPSPAERRMLCAFGAQAVSMALAPELAAAAHVGVRTAALLLLDGGWDAARLRFCRGFLEAFAPSGA